MGEKQGEKRTGTEGEKQGTPAERGETMVAPGKAWRHWLLWAAKPANAQLAMGEYKPSLLEGLRFGPISITLVRHG